jgi:large subunit ribosomal protein L4e
MNVKLLDAQGKEVGKVDMPKNFSKKMRADILIKVYESQKLAYSQGYGSKEGAGAQYSASGISKKKRHDWKGTYGKGISRVPRKIMSRNGASFNWVGATVSSTRGGRRPHAPKSEKNLFKKINKKELAIAFNTAFAGTLDSKALEEKYSRKVESGFVFKNDVFKSKTKDFVSMLKTLLGDTFEIALKKKKIRAGIGKMRGRKYKSNAGLLFVIGSDEEMKRKGISVVKVDELRVADLAPNGKPGRLACYSEAAIKEIEERFN